MCVCVCVCACLCVSVCVCMCMCMCVVTLNPFHLQAEALTREHQELTKLMKEEKRKRLHPQSLAGAVLILSVVC